MTPLEYFLIGALAFVVFDVERQRRASRRTQARIRRLLDGRRKGS